MPTSSPLQPDIDAIAASFVDQGLLLIADVLTPDQVTQAKRAVAWAMETQGGHRLIKAPTYQWHQQQPIFVDVLLHPTVLAVCDRFFPGDHHVIAAQCSRNIKAGFYAPGADKLHNDAVFFPRPERATPGVPLENYSFSAMWYLQDTPLEMGPTQLIPRSHREYDKNYTQDDIPALIEAGRWFNQPVAAGSLLLFNNRTWHRGQPNNTDTPRDLITNVYALPAVDKVQLLTTLPDGTQKYIAPGALLAQNAGRLTQLLRKRD